MCDTKDSNGSIHLLTPGILEVLCDEDALAAWELARRARAGISVQEIAGCLGRPLAAVRAAVDRLEAARLVEARRAGRGRNFVTYRTTSDSLRIAVDDVKDEGLGAAMERVHAARAARFGRLVARAAGLPGVSGNGNGNGNGDDWHCCTHASASLLPEEIERIRGIVARIEEILRFASRRSDQGVAAGPDAENGRPYALLVQMAPAAGTAPPLPDVQFVRNGDGNPPPATPANGSLSPRERQVADGLATGLTRLQIAEQLGLSPHTVGTLTRRVYRKLGARNRAQMVRALRP
jgi:DNA-binding CsgD family transcriptional regulator/DNA-binding transcriptional ArsR family regulator